MPVKLLEPMEKVIVYIGAGTNLGNRADNLSLACQLLSPAVHILRTSPVYQTEPWGYRDQESFYNLVWEAETTLPPESLLIYLKNIEKRIGRVKNFHYGPRVIDLDILLYGELIFNSEALRIPHPQMANRRFVLQPLCDLIPNGLHPELRKSWQQLLNGTPSGTADRIPEEIDFLKTVFRWGVRTYLMGIINLTPDSFSMDGIHGSADEMISEALQKTENFIQSGADILDLGAESTRPGFHPVNETEEQQRLIPVLKAIKAAYPHVTISVDTRNAVTAATALINGADWINDIGGTVHDPKMAFVCAEYQIPVVIMRGEPLNFAEDIIVGVKQELSRLVRHVRDSGVKEDQIILDPGIGFGTRPEQNLEILYRLNEIKALGFPVLIGTSRKSFIGHYLQKPVSERLAGTASTVTIGIMNGADIVRIHDVKFVYDALKITDAIIR